MVQLFILRGLESRELCGEGQIKTKPVGETFKFDLFRSWGLLRACAEHGFQPAMPKVKPLPDGRSWNLVEDFSYTDEIGITSMAIASEEHPFKFDFASIPQFAWSLIGGPATGKYRLSAIIHDWDCSIRLDPWQVVHRRFLSGMKFSGVEWWKRQALFWCVWFFGPRW